LHDTDLLVARRLGLRLGSGFCVAPDAAAEREEGDYRDEQRSLNNCPNS
jgi:hypothetical protein